MITSLAKWTEIYGDELLARHKCKVSRSTFHLWRTKGLKQKTGPFRDMLNAMSDAKDAWEARQVLGIEQSKGWQGKAWLLKNRLPEKYADTERVEHSGRNGAPIDVRKLPHMTDEELEQIARGGK